MSLLSLRTHNFQSHPDITFGFVPGINLIIGSSGNGKTVVRRALTWVKNNRPTGNKYVSFWDRDSKKNPKTKHSVTIEISDKEIIREKNPNFNGYIINPQVETFEAIGTSVPDEITKILNLSEVNIQQQWDQPFLLSDSPGKVAEFFNNIIKLNLIDEVLGKAESARRKNNRDIEDNKKLQEEIAKQIEELSWIERVAGQIKEIEDIHDKIEEKQERYNRLKELAFQYVKYEEELNSIPENLDEVLGLMKQIEDSENIINEKQDKVDKITELLEKYDKHCDELEEIQKFDFTQAEKLMAEILEIENKIIKKEQTLVKAEQILDKYKERKSLYEDLAQAEENLKYLLKQLPPQCPTCGQPVTKEMLI